MSKKVKNLARVIQPLSSTAGTRTQFSGYVSPGDSFNPCFRGTSSQSSCWPFAREGTIGDQKKRAQKSRVLPRELT